MTNRDKRFSDATAPSTGSGDELRGQAEEIVREKAAHSLEDLKELSPEESRRMLHELRVHQIELEMQNEELRKAQVNLETVRARYFDLYDLAPVGYVSIGEQGLLLEANLTAATLLGSVRSALIKQPISRFILKEDQDRYYRHRKQLFETGEHQTCELRMVKKDGTAFWAWLEATAARDAGGAAVCRMVLSDITERKRAEEMLRESEERLRDITSSMADWVWEVDENGVYTYSSGKGFDLFGSSHEDVIGKTPFDFMPPDEAKRVAAMFSEAASNKAFIRDLENWNIAKNGKRICFLTNGVPILDRVGNLKGYRGVDKDITERKRAEEEKAKLEDQLQQAQKMESVGRLAGGVAHDFNNMLSVILGHAEMALERVDPAQPLHADLVEIREAAERSANLVRQLLAFARKQIVAPKVLDLNEAVSGTLKMLRHLIGEDIDFNWRPKAGLWAVKVDPSQIDQILTNLCVNARDAIADVGKIDIEMKNITFDEEFCANIAGFAPGEYVRLAVSDDGCGMDKETLAHIFEPFFTTKNVGKGTGLGLATVYGIVKQNNGFINAYSEPGQGTTFTIYLPRHVGKTEQLQARGPEEAISGNHATVLLVEDELTILNMCRMMLESLGYSVLAASAPGEAIRLAKTHHGEIHLLMTDVVMPEMNGLDLAIKLLSLKPRIKRLFMSGYTADIIAHQGVLNEGVYFIEKPFSRNGLAAKVREALSDE